jgi:hypothetical protein
VCYVIWCVLFPADQTQATCVKKWECSPQCFQKIHYTQVSTVGRWPCIPTASRHSPVRKDTVANAVSSAGCLEQHSPGCWQRAVTIIWYELIKKLSALTGTQDSLLSSQKAVTGPYPELTDFNPCPITLAVYRSIYISSSDLHLDHLKWFLPYRFSDYIFILNRHLPLRATCPDHLTLLDTPPN